MKKFLILFIILIALLTACEQKTPDAEDLLPLTVSIIDESKTLSSFNPEGTVRYQFKALPTNEENAAGAVTEWTDFTVENEQASLGYFSQGNWEISVRVVCDDIVIVQGSASYYITADQVCCVPIYLEHIAGSKTGTLVFSIECPCQDDSAYTLSCSYQEIGSSNISVKKDWDCKTGQGKNIFSGQLNLTQGAYSFSFTYFRDGIQIGGETVAINVIGEKTQRVAGDITSVKITDDCTIINNSLSAALTTKTPDITFVWKSQDVSKSYTWYVNGKVQANSTSAFFTFKAPAFGDYTIKCVTSGGEQASSVVSYIDPVIVITEMDLAKLVMNSDYICSGFKIKGTSTKVTFPYKVEASADYTSLNDLNLEPIKVTTSAQMLASSTLIVGRNATVLTSSSVINWFGLGSKETNSTVKTVYTGKDLTLRCFYGCNALENLYILGSVRQIAKNALDSSAGIKVLQIEEGLTTIGQCAFLKCTGLTKVHIPKSVTTVDAQIFKSCSKLATITTGYGKVAKPAGWNSDWKGDCPASSPFTN